MNDLLFVSSFKLAVLTFCILLGSGYKVYEQGRRAFYGAFQLRVELAAYKERVVWQLYHLYQGAFRVMAGGYQACFHKIFLELTVKLIAVTVPFADKRAAIDLGCTGARFQLAGISAQAHGTAFGCYLLLLLH